MKQKAKDTIVMFAFMVVLLYLAGLWTYNTFFNEKINEPVKFEIVGIVNSTNATTLVQIHFECIKYCEEQNSDDYGDKQCWEQCAKLGQEECK